MDVLTFLVGYISGIAITLSVVFLWAIREVTQKRKNEKPDFGKDYFDKRKFENLRHQGRIEAAQKNWRDMQEGEKKSQKYDAFARTLRNCEMWGNPPIKVFKDAEEEAKYPELAQHMKDHPELYRVEPPRTPWDTGKPTRLYSDEEKKYWEEYYTQKGVVFTKVPGTEEIQVSLNDKEVKL